MVSGMLCISAYAQQTIDVAENVVKVGIKGEEAVYFGFAEGDQLIFSFEEANGKEMKEVEIVEMPANSRFMDVKTSKIENKILKVPKTAIYKFRFANSALLPRSCKYKIQRIPASDATLKFNSTVYYDTYNDTSYVTEVETYIDKTDTIINNFQDRTIKVNPMNGVAGSSKTTFNFTLPENTVSWSYYIMADKAGAQVYQEANKSLASNAVRALEKFPKFSPLAAVAIDAPSYLTRLDSGQRINYWIVENDNAQMFQEGQQFRFLKKGRVVNDFGKMEPGDRAFYFCLHNDSKETNATVTVKITAILINEKLLSQPVKKMRITPKNGMHLRN